MTDTATAMPTRCPDCNAAPTHRVMEHEPGCPFLGEHDRLRRRDAKRLTRIARRGKLPEFTRPVEPVELAELNWAQSRIGDNRIVSGTVTVVLVGCDRARLFADLTTAAGAKVAQQ
ncbi:hypothetical protein [Mycolicibacter algericus]|uniref:Uncharacterized protein n=2 Tax=Mycolicibacter algericus TaxID=1288388 RepID=A0A7I9Y7A9_MYCAL|nr:hypothetical protein [Mycolicibacter algericus]OQZ99071.1 hypothetical protein BST10_02455 [Mycolicibacter algericus DSM 45454]GFG84569.1 hypothetical protein MALGJ_12450 [Mycolicibacter algericus]